MMPSSSRMLASSSTTRIRCRGTAMYGLLLRLAGRDANHQGGAAAFARRGPDGAVVGCNDARANGESHANPLLSFGVERLENLVDFVRLDPGPLVVEADL